MKWFLTLFLTLPIWAQNNYAIDFNSAQNDKLYRAVANYRASDQVGFISCWVRYDALNNFMSFLGSGDTLTSSYYVRLNYYNSGTRWAVAQYNNDGAIDAQGAPFSPSIETWYHFVGGSNGSQYLVWVNGVAGTIQAIAGSNTGDWFADTPATRDNIAIGIQQTVGLFAPMEGQIDEVSVHNVTPTQSLVDAIYNGGTPRDVRNIGSSGVVSYWRFEEGTGQYALDSVGSDTLVFGDDATVETDDPAWIAAGLGWDSGSNRPLTPYKTSISTYRSY